MGRRNFEDLHKASIAINYFSGPPIHCLARKGDLVMFRRYAFWFLNGYQVVSVAKVVILSFHKGTLSQLMYFCVEVSQ